MAYEPTEPTTTTALLLATEASGPPAFLAPTAALVVAAALIGYLSVRVRVVPIVGFLLAGVLIGPAQLGLVERQEVVESAAEIGVILLLFTIGIEFSLQRLMQIKRYILLGGGLQVALTAGLTTGVLALAGVDWRDGLFTGFLVALSSTAIVLKVLGDAGESGTTRGRLALAMLILQDLAVVLMVLVVPLLGEDDGGGGGGGPLGLAAALGTAAAVIAVVLVLARRVMPPLLERVARLCSPEVFLLAVVAICFGTAYLTALAGVSVALGAFLAGLVVSESRHAAHVFGEIMPLQIIFSAVFFVSVGMLLDLGYVMDNLPLLAGLVLLVVAVKVVAAGLAGLALRERAGTALGTALLLAQVGEFSFVLDTVGAEHGLSPFGLTDDGSQALVGATVILMVLTPLLSAAGRLADRRVGRRPAVLPSVPAQGDGSQEGARAGHVVVSGWGPAARTLALDLQGRRVPVVVTTLSPDGAAEAEADGHEVVRGDPTKLPVLHAAGVQRAAVVVIPEDDVEQAARIAAVVRGTSSARIVVRPVEGGSDPATLGDLADAGVDKVVDRDRSSHGMLAKSVLAELPGVPPALPPEGVTRVDTSRLVHYAVPADACPHAGVSAPVLPSAMGCEECLRAGDRWVHLRLCLTCGHVGCCDSSPGRHARAHGDEHEHPYIASLEPGEAWAYCFLDATTVPRPARSGWDTATGTARTADRTEERA